VYLLQSRVDDAILWFEKARSAAPGQPFTYGYLAAAYALRATPNAPPSHLPGQGASSATGALSIARLTAVGYAGNRSWGVPKVQALFEATYFAGLRKAGVPEE
jgi:hypothetical protein